MYRLSSNMVKSCNILENCCYFVPCLSDYILFAVISELYRFDLISTVETYLYQQTSFISVHLFKFNLRAFICKMFACASWLLLVLRSIGHFHNLWSLSHRLMISSPLPRLWSFVYLLFWFCNSLFFFEFDIVDIALPWLELYLFQPFCCFAPYFLSCLPVVMFSPLTLFSILQIF